ncbi:hypothetical protein CHUAL_006888 [Chamberlinius hualienensis]
MSSGGTCVSPTSFYCGDSSSPNMHSSQAPAETPRIQRNRVKDIVAQFNQEAQQREKIKRFNSYEPTDNYGYSPSPPPPIPLPLNNGNHHRNGYPQRSKSEHNLMASPDGVVYAQVQVHNGNSTKNDVITNGKYKTTVHTVVSPTPPLSNFNRYNTKLAKSTGSLHKIQPEDDEEEDNRVLNSLNSKGTNNKHSYYRFDDPANDSLKNVNVYSTTTRNRNGYGSINNRNNQKSKWKANSDDEVEIVQRNGNSYIIPLRLSNGNETSPPPAFHTKNVEKWSEKEDLGPNRRKFTEHEKVHLVTVTGDSCNGDVRIKSPSPLLKSIRNSEFDDEEASRLRRHRESTSSPLGSNYSKKTTTLEDSVHQRSRTVTPTSEPLTIDRTQSRSPKVDVGHYYYGQPTKTSTSRQHFTETFHEKEDNHWRGGNRSHSTDSGNGGVLLSSKLVKLADAELNSSPNLSPIMTSSWRRDEDDVFVNGNHEVQLRSLSPRLRPLSPSSGISSVHSGGSRVVGETKEEKRHFRKQETTKTTKHETERSRVKPSEHRSRSAERHHRQLELTEEPLRSTSTGRRRRHKVNGKGYYHEDKMETSESENQIYGGSLGSHMSVEDHQRALMNEKENIIAANTPSSMLKQVNKNTISYENAQRHDTNDVVSSNGHTGKKMWFERINDDVDGGRMSSSATLSRLEKKNRRNHYSDNELSVNTVDRRDVMRRRKNHHHHNGGSDHQVARSSSFNSRVDSYHSEIENESQASSTASKPKRVNFKPNGFLSPTHREALMRSTSPVRAPSIASNDSEMSNRSVILHATAVADIPAPAQYRQRSANTSPAPSISGSADGRSSSLSRRGRQKDSRTVQRSFSLLSPWKPKKYKEKATSGMSHHQHQQHSQHSEQKIQQQQKSQESLSHHSSSAERLDSLSPLPSETTSTKSKKKAGLLHRRHSMPKDSRFANFFKRKNKESKKK